MCQSKAEGGKRCEYAAMIGVVRRKAQRQNAKEYHVGSSYQRAIKEAVWAWQEENSEIVMAHLPERRPFQVKPGKHPVPEELLGLLSRSGKDSIRGFDTDERSALTQSMYDEHEQWKKNMTEKEETAVIQYGMNAFEYINTYLRRSGFAQWKKENPHLWRQDETREEIAQRMIASLDSAFRNAPAREEPQKLYRFFRVPAGVEPGEYINRYFQKGEGFKDAAFMSTTADPEFIMAHMEDRNGGSKNKGYVVMEMVSKRGASLQPDPRTGGRIQSLEHEVLLPRNTKFRIAGARKSQRFEFASDRDDLQRNYHPHDYWKKHYREGDSLRFPVIQMIDEELITEHYRKDRK